MIQYVLNCSVTYIRKWGKLYNINQYEHVLKLVRQVYSITERRVQANKIISSNKLDIKIRDNKQVTCMSIYVEVSADRNVIKKKAEKIVNHKDFKIKVQHMWNVKANVIPAITGRPEPSQNHSDSLWAAYWESAKSRNYRNQPYCALHTNCGNCWCKGTEHIVRGK